MNKKFLKQQLDNAESANRVISKAQNEKEIKTKKGFEFEQIVTS